ncbi:MAG: TldD/PmbA family protein [Gemmatimonadaceae bacterium]|nr:TldD/PmbA family protein [Gemmatimonadaceae bacterium]
MAPKSLLQGEASFLSRDEAKRLADRVVSFSKADDVRVNIRSGWAGNTRFAGGQVTTSGNTVDTSVTVLSRIGRKQASTTTNVLDDESLRRAVDLSERMAKLSPDDPEMMPELGPQQYIAIQNMFESTRNLTPEQRVAAANAVIGAGEEAWKGARSEGSLFTAGFLQATAGANAVANSKGLFAYQPSSNVSLSNTARTPDGTGSGWASSSARDWAKVDAAYLGRRAAQKAVQSRSPAALEPGFYTVVLEPAASSQLVGQVAGALNARAAEEGRNAFSLRGGGTKLGQKVFDERVTFYSDPADPEVLADPFDGEGFPVGRHVWIERGVLRELQYDRYWAERKGVKATMGGGGRGRGGGGGGGFGGGIRMTPGAKTLDQLIAECRRGVLCTHFFYTNVLDPKTMLLTGITRDGTFLIENGRVVRPVKNFRFNQSIVQMLNSIEEIGRPDPGERGTSAPPMRVTDFNFASISDAV